MTKPTAARATHSDLNVPQGSTLESENMLRTDSKKKEPPQVGLTSPAEWKVDFPFQELM